MIIDFSTKRKMWIRGFLEYEDGMKLAEATEGFTITECEDYEEGCDAAYMLEKWANDE
jgi:hypothetical protein